MLPCLSGRLAGPCKGPRCVMSCPASAQATASALSPQSVGSTLTPHDSPGIEPSPPPISWATLSAVSGPRTPAGLMDLPLSNLSAPLQACENTWASQATPWTGHSPGPHLRPGCYPAVFPTFYPQAGTCGVPHFSAPATPGMAALFCSFLLPKSGASITIPLPPMSLC